jgi:hypothetical protein
MIYMQQQESTSISCRLNQPPPSAPARGNQIAHTAIENAVPGKRGGKKERQCGAASGANFFNGN